MGKGKSLGLDVEKVAGVHVSDLLLDAVRPKFAPSEHEFSMSSARAVLTLVSIQ